MLSELTEQQTNELLKRVSAAFRSEFPFGTVLHVSRWPPLLFEKTDELGALLCNPTSFEELVEWACWHSRLFGKIRAEQSRAGDRVYLCAWEPYITLCGAGRLFKISESGCVAERLVTPRTVEVPEHARQYHVGKGKPYQEHGLTKELDDWGNMTDGRIPLPEFIDKAYESAVGSVRVCLEAAT